MTATSDDVRIQVAGPDFRVEENLVALMDYVKNTLCLVLTASPQVLKDGKAVIPFSRRGHTESDVLASLSQSKHFINNQDVFFAPFSELTSHGIYSAAASGQQGVSMRPISSVGRGRGILGMARQVVSPSGRGQRVDSSIRLDARHFQASTAAVVAPGNVTGSSTAVSAPVQRFSTSSSPGFDELQSFRDSSIVSPQSRATFQSMGHLFDYQSLSPTQTQTYQTTIQTRAQHGFPLFDEMSEVHEVYPAESDVPTEGLNVIRITGLPESATREGVKDLLWKTLSTNKSTKANIEIALWSKDDVRIHFENFQAVSNLWRNRHIRPLKYGDCVLFWDIVVEDTYQDDRILVGNLPEGITQYKLLLHLQSTGCIGAEIKMQLAFCNDNKEAVVFLDDTIADDKLIEDLTKEGSQFESDDDCTLTTISYALVPYSRTVQLSGLDASVNKGTIRKYFQVLPQLAAIEQPLLVEDIKTNCDEGVALVKFRTRDGLNRLLQIGLLPEIGEQNLTPQVSLSHTYPSSATEQSAKEEPAELEDVETTEDILFTPEPPEVMAYVWNNTKHKKKLLARLQCESVSFDDNVVSIVGKATERDNYLRTLEEFLENYALRTYLIKDQRLWDSSCNFIETERQNRDSEVDCIPVPDQVAYKFIGPENDMKSLFQFCADTIGTRREKLEEQTAETNETLAVASKDHLQLLQESDTYNSVMDTCHIESRQVGDKIVVDIKGPNASVRSAKDKFVQFLNCLETVSVTLPDSTIQFLQHYGLSCLSKVYSDAKVEATPASLEESSVRLVVSMTAREGAMKIAKETFVAVSLTDLKDDEVQTFFRSHQFSQYMKSLSNANGVLLEPSHDRIKDSAAIVVMQVVGTKVAAQKAANELSTFVANEVLYRKEVAVNHPGCFRYVERFTLSQVNELAVRYRQYQSRIDICRPKASNYWQGSVVFHCTKQGLSKLQSEVDKFTSSFKVDKTFAKHGLLRYFSTDLFSTKRSNIEKKYKTVVYLDCEKELEEREEEEYHERKIEMAEELVVSSSTVFSSSLSSRKISEFKNRQNPSTKISIFLGDICRHVADGIVNPANENLEHLGGVSGHIVKTAGSIVQKQSTDYVSKYGKLKVGSSMRTSPGSLTNCKHIIHTVGPQWPRRFHLPGAKQKVEEKLLSAVRSSLEVAQEHGCRSVCFPAISTGRYGCPSEFVAKHMVKSASDFLAQTNAAVVKEIHFILLHQDKDNVRCFEKECIAVLESSGTFSRDVLLPIVSDVGFLTELPSTTSTNPDVGDEERLKISTRSLSSEDMDCLTTAAPSTSRSGLNTSITLGDITSEKVDVIINSTNGSLELESAPASKAVLKASGPQLQLDCTAHVKDKGKLKTGDIFSTAAYNLPCKNVIHVVCPNSRKGLEDLVVKCLIEADRLGSQSVAFPALGTGNLGMSDEDSAKGILDGIDAFSSRGSSTVTKVVVVVFDKAKFPKFQAEHKKAPGVLDVVSPSFPDDKLPDAVQLNNGLMLTIQQGDVTTENSDVIVAPLGIVFGAVVKKSPQVNEDLKARFSGTPKPVADLTNGSKLACKRVFAISVPSKGKRGDDESIKCIRDVVFTCLDMANTSGHSSIAIPAIGTGGLGYTNVHAAAAVIEASTDFSTKVANPSLKRIKISVFDAHRLPDFQKELKSRTSAVTGSGVVHRMASGVYSGVASRLKSVSSMIATAFTADETKEMKKKKKPTPPLKSFSSGNADVATVSVVGPTSQICDNAMDAVEKCINKSCIHTSEPIGHNIPEGVDPKTFQDLAAKHGVALKLDVPEGTEATATITLEGFKEDVREVQAEVYRLLTIAFKEEKEASDRDRILGSYSWLWQDDDNSYKEYDDDAVVKLELAHERNKRTVKVNQRGKKIEIDLIKMEQRDGGKTRKVIRNDKAIGFQFPETWYDQGGNGKHEYECHSHQLQASDSEYKEVEKLFVDTGGKGTIVRIDRVQNPKLYVSYIHQKQFLTKKRQKQIQDGTACVDRRLFHGTDPDTVLHITHCGFNRSFAGSAVGKLFGSGVYFADTAKYSCNYARAKVGHDRKLFVCDVLLGLSTVGNAAMLEPPIINSAVSSTDRYDSTVNNITNPTIFASCYRDNMAYPTYLISFK